MKCLDCGNYLIQDFFGYLNGNKVFHCNNKLCNYEVNNSVEFKDNWWFACRYELYFKYDNKYYCIIGNAGDDTLFFVFGFNSNSKQYWTKVISIPHYGLPVNDDFDREAQKLVDKLKKNLILL